MGACVVKRLDLQWLDWRLLDHVQSLWSLLRTALSGLADPE